MESLLWKYSWLQSAGIQDDFLKNGTSQQEEKKEKNKTLIGFVYCLLVQTEEPCNNFAIKFQTSIYLKEETKWEEPYIAWNIISIPGMRLVYVKLNCNWHQNVAT